MSEGLAIPCPFCGHYALFFVGPEYPSPVMHQGNRPIGCCNPLCDSNTGEDDEDDDD